MQYLTVAVTWIAIKIEEQTLLATLTEVAMVFHVLHLREDGDNVTVEHPEGEKFVKMKSDICSKYEMGVFDALGFICHVDHPHKLTSNIPGLIFYDKEMKRDEIPEGLLQVRSAELCCCLNQSLKLLAMLCFEVVVCQQLYGVQEAWSLANDSLQAPLCVRFRSLTIACACVFLAARRLSITMPEDPPWWEFAGTSFQDIVTVCQEILSVYKLPPPVYISVNKGETAASVDKKLAEQSVSQVDSAAVGSGAAPGREEEQLPGPPPPSAAPATSQQPSDAAVFSDQSPARSAEPNNGSRPRQHSRQGQGHGQLVLGRSDRTAGGRENRRQRDSGRSRHDRDGSPRSAGGARKAPGNRGKDRSHPNDNARKDGYPDRFGAGSDDESPLYNGRQNGSQGGERHDRGGRSSARDNRQRRDDRREDRDNRGGDPDRRYRESDAARRKRDDGGAEPRFREPDSRGSARSGVQQKGRERDSGHSRGDMRQNNDGGSGSARKSPRKPLDWDEMSKEATKEGNESTRPQKRSPSARASGEELSDRAPKVHRSEARM